MGRAVPAGRMQFGSEAPGEFPCGQTQRRALGEKGPDLTSDPKHSPCDTAGLASAAVTTGQRFLLGREDTLK